MEQIVFCRHRPTSLILFSFCSGKADAFDTIRLFGEGFSNHQHEANIVLTGSRSAGHIFPRTASHFGTQFNPCWVRKDEHQHWNGSCRPKCKGGLSAGWVVDGSQLRADKTLGGNKLG